MIAPFAIVFTIFASSRLFSDPYESGWFTRFMMPTIWLPSLLYVAVMVIWRKHIVYLEEIPDPDANARPFERPPAEPGRMRITIRQMMIAVALVAILFGAVVEWGRYTRRDYFRNKASVHASFEPIYRKLEQDMYKHAVALEKTNASMIMPRQIAAKAGAVADYHAAMRHKYEEAASHRVFSVEPDPPAPPWP
jgi:hypothetical protein